MMNRLTDTLLDLTPRERGLLALAVVVVLPLAVIFGVVEPLQTTRTATATRLTDAQALDSWLRAQVIESRTLPQLGTGTTTQQDVQAPIGTSGVEQSLIEAQLRSKISRLSTGAQGQIEVQFDSVDFIRIANWLGEMHPDWGYQIERLQIEASDAPAQVSVWLQLSQAR